MNINAVLFDLDGTLIDSESIHRIVWPMAVADLGYSMTDDQFLALRSLGRPFVQAQVKEWWGEDFDYPLAREIRKRYFAEYLEKHGPLPVKPGAFELLKYLREKGITTAVATATDLARATQSLSELNLLPYFDKVISAHMVKEGKPSPDVYLYACEQIGEKPENCIAVEDSPNGIRSAYRAGCNVIMVPDQTPPDEELKGMIHACVNTLDEIIPLIK